MMLYVSNYYIYLRSRFIVWTTNVDHFFPHSQVHVGIPDGLEAAIHISYFPCLALMIHLLFSKLIWRMHLNNISWQCFWRFSWEFPLDIWFVWSQVYSCINRHSTKDQLGPLLFLGSGSISWFNLSWWHMSSKLVVLGWWYFYRVH